jgi:hypothetical protein
MIAGRYDHPLFGLSGSVYSLRKIVDGYRYSLSDKLLL